MLCAGSKSAKLAAAWELLDDDGDGLLTRRGLWRYLRSFLTILMGACEVATEEGLNTVRVAADEGAIWLSTHIFTQAATNTACARPLAFSFLSESQQRITKSQLLTPFPFTIAWWDFAGLGLRHGRAA